jgi:hypothetical protein
VDAWKNRKYHEFAGESKGKPELATRKRKTKIVLEIGGVKLTRFFERF